MVSNPTSSGPDGPSPARSEEHYRLLFERNPLPTWVYDVETLRFLSVNEAAVRTYGYSREEFLAMTIKDVRPQEEVPKLLRFLDALARNPDEAGDLTWLHRRKDGSLLWVEPTSIDIDFAGRPARLVCAKEVTEQQRAQRELRDAAALMDQAQSVARIGSWKVTYEGGEARLTWSDGTYELFGAVPGEFVPTREKLLALVHPEDRPRLLEAIEERSRLAGPVEVDYRVQRPDGEVRWVREKGRVFPGTDDSPPTLLGVVMDITERKTAEEEQRRLTERLSDTLESITDAFFTVDREWRFTYVNTEAEKVLQRERDSLLGRSVWDEFPEARGSTFHTEYNKALTSGSRVAFVEYYPPLDTWFDVRAYPSEHGLSVYFQDVTKRREAEARLRKSEASLAEAQRLARMGSWEYDLREDRIYWSDEVFRMLGYEQRVETLTLADFMAHVPPEDMADAESLYEQLERGDIPSALKMRLVRKDGGVITVLERIQLERGADGTVVGARGTVQDITEQEELERALREKELLFRTAADCATDCIYDWWVDEPEMVWYGRMNERFGGDTSGMTVSIERMNAMIHPGDRERVLALVDHCVRTGDLFEIDYRVIDPAGNVRYWTDRGQFIMRDGRPVRMIGTQTDVTEKTLAEEARRRSEARFRKIFESDLIGILFERPDGAIVDCNEVFADLIGYTVEDVREGRANWEKLTPREFRPQDEWAIRELAAEGRCTPYEKAFVRKDGNHVPVLAGAAAVEEGLNVWFVLDITDRKRAERALVQANLGLEEKVAERTRELERLYRRQAALSEFQLAIGEPADLQPVLESAAAIIEKTMPRTERVAIALWDAEKGRYTTLASASDGRTEDILTFLEKLPGDPCTAIRKTLRPAVVRDFGRETDMGYPNEWGAGAYLAVPIVWGDDFLGGLIAVDSQVRDYTQGDIDFMRALGDRTAVAVARARLLEDLRETNNALAAEVQERAKAEKALEIALESVDAARQEAERANQAKSEFLSRMSHELRTPLNAILGFAQVLEMTSTNESERRSLAHIMKAGRHLLGLINEVLDISRIESDSMSVSVEPVRWRPVLQECLDLLKPQTTERRITVAADIDADVPTSIQADVGRLRQVLLNILSNAVKYNREGGQIRVAATRFREDFLRVSITDTGEGIPEDMLERIFVPFERLGAERTNVEGSGLGMPLAKQLVESMGGSILVESATGQGTTVTVELPAAEEDDKLEKARESSSGEAVPMIQEGALILYIEDNPSNVEVVERVIGSATAYQFESAVTGGEGLENAVKHQPALILLDMHLPDQKGAQVLGKLRADPRTATIPVVIVTADASLVAGRTADELGAAGVVTKPIDIGPFVKMVRRLVEGRSK